MKAGKLAIEPKSQFLFHKNLPLRDFSTMTLVITNQHQVIDCMGKVVEICFCHRTQIFAKTPLISF